MPKSNTDLAGRKYFPAVLKHLAVGWQIDYYVQHPQTGEMVRQRMKLNRMRARYHTTAQFRIAAMEIVTNINVRLAGGWTPYFDAENVRYYTRLPEVISLYLSEKERELRPATYSTYKNWCDTFLSWCKDNRIADTYASLVNRVTAVSFTDYLYNSHHLSARSYNNMVKQGRAFFNWCKEKCYVKDNPFEQIAKKREQPKRRILVPAQERRKITEHLRETNSAFLIVCELVYSSLIRPNEIRHLKIKDLHLSELYIEIPADITKDHHDSINIHGVLHMLCMRVSVSGIGIIYLAVLGCFAAAKHYNNHGKQSCPENGNQYVSKIKPHTRSLQSLRQQTSCSSLVTRSSRNSIRFSKTASFVCVASAMAFLRAARKVINCTTLKAIDVLVRIDNMISMVVIVS